MSYRFVQAKYYSPGAIREVRALTVHMAEGGGTVEWLSGGVTNDNSSHFVIRNTGEIVQMVRDTDADHSLHVARSFGPPGVGDFGIYSLDTARKVLGDGWSDPNRYMFAVEIEGYAYFGPNALQKLALRALVGDLRRRFPTMRGVLGHRDFQDYKPCPGGLIPWNELGGHGLFDEMPESDTAPEGPVMPYTVAGRRFPWYVRKGTTLNAYDPARPGGPVTTVTFEADSQGLATGIVDVGWAPGTDPGAPSGGPFLPVSEGTLDGLLILRSAVSLEPFTEPPVTVTGTIDATVAPDGKSAVVTIKGG